MGFNSAFKGLTNCDLLILCFIDRAFSYVRFDENQLNLINVLFMLKSVEYCH